MALIRLLFENQVKDKHVESLLLPRLDAGSTPASSTFLLSKPKQKTVTTTLSAKFDFPPKQKNAKKSISKGGNSGVHRNKKKTPEFESNALICIVLHFVFFSICSSFEMLN